MLRPISLELAVSRHQGIPWKGISVWTIGFTVLLLVTTSLKLVLITRMGFELSFDEAYYWHWSRQLDWCYFSKGPGIAVLIRSTTALFGDSELGVRAGALGCSTVTLVLIYVWTRHFFQCDRTAFIVAILTAAVPMFFGTGVLTTIDSPLLACWTAAAAAAWMAIETRALRWWFVVGVVLAIGIQFKFTMLFFIASLFLFFLGSQRERSALNPLGPAIATVVVVLSSVPMLIWNARHDWITFLHTADKATTGLETSLVNGRHVLPSLIQQFGVVSPVVCAASLVALVYLLRDCTSKTPDNPGRLDRRRAWFLVSLALPMVAFYSLLSFHRMIEPNWMAAAYLSLIPAAGYYWLRPGTRVQRASLWIAVLVGFSMQVLIFAVDAAYRWNIASAVFAPETGFKPKLDVTNRLHGWREMARTTAGEATAVEQATGKPIVFLADHYSYAAWLGFYGGLSDRVFVIPSGRPHNQFDLWALKGRVPQPGANALISYELERSGRDASYLFTEYQWMYRTFPIYRGPVAIRSIRLDRGIGFLEERWWKAMSH